MLSLASHCNSTGVYRHIRRLDVTLAFARKVEKATASLRPSLEMPGLFPQSIIMNQDGKAVCH